MGGLIQLAMSALLAASRAGSLRVATIRTTAAAICAVLAAVLIVSAIGCAAAALWIVALPSLGPAGAPLVVAAALLAVALILAVITVLILRHWRRGPGIDRAPQFLLSDATRLFNEHKGAVLLTALVAGMAAANEGRKT